MVVVLCNTKLAFVAANALEASSRADPITTLLITRLLEIVANFIAAPYFLSRNHVGKRLGRPGSRPAREKHSYFRANRLQCCRWGCADKSPACSAAMGVFSPGPPNRA